MSKFRQLKPKDIEKLVKKEGYIFLRHGRHGKFYEKEVNGRFLHVEIPDRRDGIPIGTMKSIIRAMELTNEEFIELVRKYKI